MFKMPEKITYALPEQIGNTDLFVGRKKEFDFFLGVWYNRLIGNIAQSQAIVARRKKGKTAFLQRLFNILWSSPTSGVIPFYYVIQDRPLTLAALQKIFIPILWDNTFHLGIGGKTTYPFRSVLKSWPRSLKATDI